MADDARTSRKSTTRDKEARRKPWAPPSRLDAPDPPEGFIHRWIRVAMRGEEDKMNVNTKLREGWEPVRKDEYPDYDIAVIDEGQYEGIIGQGGLMLCRIPEETARERAEYYGTRTLLLAVLFPRRKLRLVVTLVFLVCSGVASSFAHQTVRKFSLPVGKELLRVQIQTILLLRLCMTTQCKPSLSQRLMWLVQGIQKLKFVLLYLKTSTLRQLRLEVMSQVSLLQQQI